MIVQNNNNNNNNSLQSINIYSVNNSIDNINNPIINQLIEFGFNSLYSKRIFLYYHPQNVEDALDYLSFENGIIQHHFVQDRNAPESNICYLCGEERNVHLNSNPIDVSFITNRSNINNTNNNINNNNHNNFNINNNSNNDINSDININNIDYNDFFRFGRNNANNHISRINDSLEMPRQKKIINDKSKIECPTCSELFSPSDNNKLKNCGHSFCNDCWFNFLSIKIKENKITSIKCLDYECQEKPDDNFIFNLLNNDEALIEKYKKFKVELDILNDANKKFCPFPNCDSYLELKNEKNKYVKCLNNHEFCFLCLNKPHGELECNKAINNCLDEYSKNKLIKKCPNCGIITEKYEGCNHITCSKCNYQWCWLCNGKYSEDHFNQGKCKGFQFFRPKDEEDIKLAFEGKIELRESQRQEDLSDEPFEFFRDSIRENSINNSINSNININNLNSLPNIENNHILNFSLEENSINQPLNPINNENNNNNSIIIPLRVDIQNSEEINATTKSFLTNINDSIIQNQRNIQENNVNNINQNNNQNISLNISQNNKSVIINKYNEQNIGEDKISQNSSFSNFNKKNVSVISENNIENNSLNKNLNDNNENNNKYIIIQNKIPIINVNNDENENKKDTQEDDKNKEENKNVIIEKEIINNENNNEKDNIEMKNSEQNSNIDNLENSHNKINRLNNNNINIDNDIKIIKEENKNENNIDNISNKDEEKNNSVSLHIYESNTINNEKNPIFEIKNIPFANITISPITINKLNDYNIDIKSTNSKKDNDNIIEKNDISKLNDNNNSNQNNENITNNINNLEKNNKNDNNGNLRDNNNKRIKIVFNRGESITSQESLILKAVANKQNKKIEMKNEFLDKIYSFNRSQRVLIIFIYIFFGHIFIPINIFLQKKKHKIIILSFFIFQIPYFFIQFLFNILMIFIYAIKDNLESFISEFYNNIKIQYKVKYKFHLITIYTYYIILMLFTGTYFEVLFILKNIIKTNNKLFFIIGFIFSLLIIPFHIIINPIILLLIGINNKCDSRKILIKIKEFTIIF